MLVHVANLLMSMLSSGQFSIKLDASSVSGRGLGLGTLVAATEVDANGRYRPNPCSFYLLNLAIDVSIETLSLIQFFICLSRYIGVWFGKCGNVLINLAGRPQSASQF